MISFLLMGSLLFSSQESSYKEVPKAELHLHLGGAYPKEYLFSICNSDQKQALSNALDLVAKKIDYNKVFTVFQVIAQVVNTEEKVQKGVESLCQSLIKDGVRYVEIRTGLKNFGNGHEEYLKAVLEGMKKSQSEQFIAKLVLSLQRNSTLESAKTTISLAKKYRNQGIVGIDISGDSTVGNSEQMMEELLLAKNEGLLFLVHMGEHVSEKDQMYLLENLEPKRVGHAVYLREEAREWIIEHQIPIEVCLSSSVLVNMINHVGEHPGIDFYRIGHPIVFCTDDPLLFTTSLSKELALANEFCGLSEDEIKNIVECSFRYALYQ